MGPLMRLPRLLLPLVAVPAIAAACEAGIVEPTSSSSSSSSSSGSQGGGGSGPVDAGSDAPPPIDGGPCTKAEDCTAFNDPCNAGTCINGSCAKTPANNFASCDDGLFCTENDSCQDGVCVGGTPKICKSSDSCHLGVCDEALDTCKTIPGNDGAPCDDMNTCTYSGKCMSGACVQGNPVDCSVFDGQCTTGVCIPGVGCAPQPANEGGACDDGMGGQCSFGQCSAGSCVSLPKANGDPCNDFLFCTINDHCSNGMCVGDPNPCTPPNNPCYIGVCNEGAQNCITTIGNNGASCEDGNPCTAGETCSNGNCIGGAPVANGTACDDKNGCTFGTTCLNGNCGNATSTTTICQTGDQCCPAGCALNTDADCLYWATGVQQNVPPATLQGWNLCYSGFFGDSFPPLQNILSQCNKANLLMACRPQGQQNWQLLAMAPRLDVTFDCGTQNNCTKQANGVGWYYDESWSWGFAPGGEAVNRNSCDFDNGNQTFPQLRMCWHTGGNNISSGYRCGTNITFGSDYERAVFHAD